jgi:Tol biopolymer transport system component/predicted Ser/Thr protein kinase
MSVSSGTHLGPYEILASIGAGGMGEVYRATDTRLRREVAIKISTERFSERFEREARAVASLNHPNICTVHDVGPNYLVMELIEGATLAERIRQAAVPLDEALRIARQIADALEAAHDKGIVHRDLKPGNVKIKPDGTVKVLDFGLAKMAANPAGALDNSPTFTLGSTQEGMILGTAAYMSPEQARGQAIDRRADIWAFGCVVYETLTGKRVFEGETLTDVLAAVVKTEPDWDALPPDTPRLVRSLLRRCLQKDPVSRLHDIADARIEIQEAVAEPDALAPRAAGRRGATTSVRAIPWIVAALSALALLGAYVGSGRAAGPREPGTGVELALPSGVEPYIGPSALAFSPDGTRIAFVGIEAGNRQLYLRRLDEFDALPVRGTAGATAIFFSPDGRSIAFILTDRTMKKVSLEDGLVVTLAPEVDYTTGGAWGADDRITFGRKSVLWQRPTSGGPATQLTTLDSQRGALLHAFPTVISSGKALLFATVTGVNRGAAHIEALSLTGGPARRIKVNDSGTSPSYVESGQLIFFRGDTLLAAAFDEEHLQVTGPAVRVIDQVGMTSVGAPMLAVSHSGSVAYTKGTAATQLVWVSRQGREQTLTDGGRQYAFPRLAPDGRHVVVSAGGDLWIQDTARPTLAKLTTDATTGNTHQVWTPDGKRVVYRTNAGLYWMDADGSGRSQAIPQTTTADYPNSVSPDGETLIFLRTTADTSADLYVLSLRGEPRPRPLVSTKAHEGGGQFSPDGKWVAYASDESGQFQVFLRPFPGPDRKWLVSQAGKYVTWNRNGKELFFRDGNKMMAVEVLIRNGEPVLSSPRLLFDQRYEFGTAQTVPNYDVSPDGQRFVMVKGESGSRRLSVVLNGFDDLMRLAPPSR